MLAHMRRTTVTLPDHLDARLRQEAAPRRHRVGAHPTGDRDVPRCVDGDAASTCSECRRKRTVGHLRADRRDPRKRGAAVALIVDAVPPDVYIDRDYRHDDARLDLLEPIWAGRLVGLCRRNCGSWRVAASVGAGLNRNA